jgi:hypothetical protein
MGVLPGSELSFLMEASIIGRGVGNVKQISLRRDIIICAFVAGVTKKHLANGTSRRPVHQVFFLGRVHPTFDQGVKL